MGRLTYIFIASCLILFSACSTIKFNKPETKLNNINIRNSAVYIYSFLDIREDEFGPSMLAELNKQLVQVLSNSGVPSKILRFKDSEYSKTFSLVDKSMSIPVQETILGNANQEQEFGAKYRMIVFPTEMSTSNMSNIYVIRWDLVDLNTGEIMWSITSRGTHMKMWKNDEAPEARAKTIVDGFVNEMMKSNML